VLLLSVDEIFSYIIQCALYVLPRDRSYSFIVVSYLYIFVVYFLSCLSFFLCHDSLTITKSYSQLRQCSYTSFSLSLRHNIFFLYFSSLLVDFSFRCSIWIFFSSIFRCQFTRSLFSLDITLVFYVIHLCLAHIYYPKTLTSIKLKCFP